MLFSWIVKAYSLLIKIGFWVSLLAAVVIGYYNFSFVGLLIGALVWLVFAVVGFGFLLVLVDIRDRVERIEAAINNKDQDDQQNQD